MPLAPVPPLAPPPAPPPSPPATPRPEDGGGLTALLTVAVFVSLALNGLLGWNFWHTQRVQNDRLARLESGAAPTGVSNKEDPDPAVGKLPRRATGDQRLAALLAVAGDGERCRRLLENVTPEECVQIGQALLVRPAASDRNGALSGIVGYLAVTRPDLAVGLLDGVREGTLRATLARQLAEAWTASHADAAANWLAGDGTRFLTPAAASAPLVRAITQWSTFDPEAATRFVAARPLDRGPVARSLTLASHAWGQTNPNAALAWASALPVNDPRYLPALQGVWEGWTEADPAQAGTALRQALFGGANNRPPVELAGAVARQWAQADPAAAAQWAAGLPPGGGARGAALYQVATVWALADAPEAARWAATLPGGGGETRVRIWREIINDWADNDPPAAGTWLGTLPPGRDHDEAVGAYLPKVEPVEPERALAWAATVGDPEIRAGQVQDVLSRWVRRDPPAARSWAAANAVPILPLRATAGP